MVEAKIKGRPFIITSLVEVINAGEPDHRLSAARSPNFNSKSKTTSCPIRKQIVRGAIARP